MVIFEFDDFVFEGIKFKKEHEYPWSNKTEKTKFYRKLFKERSKEQAIKFVKREAGEDIHINLSRSIIAGAISVACIILMALTLSLFTMFGTFVLACIGFIALFMKYVFEKRAKSNWMSLKLNIYVINKIF